MSQPESVNGAVIDSVTQANVKVLGNAPAQALGNLYIATSQALSNAAQNATHAQQQAFITSQAATTQGVMSLLSLEAEPGPVTKKKT